MTPAPVAPPPSSTEPQPPRLQRGVLTVPNAIALSAAAMAPVLAVVLNAPAAVPAGRGGGPPAVVASPPAPAAMAPVLAVVLNAPAAVPAAGAAIPLSFVLAFIAAALVGNTVVQFARE